MNTIFYYCYFGSILYKSNLKSRWKFLAWTTSHSSLESLASPRHEQAWDATPVSDMCYFLPWHCSRRLQMSVRVGQLGWILSALMSASCSRIFAKCWTKKGGNSGFDWVTSSRCVTTPKTKRAIISYQQDSYEAFEPGNAPCFQFSCILVMFMWHLIIEPGVLQHGTAEKS